MKRIAKIALIIVGAIVIALMVTNLITHSQIRTEVTINAPAEDVWSVLMDHESYGEWNPFIKQISGDTEVGNIISVTVQSPNNDPMDFTPEVLVRDVNQEFRWVGSLGFSGIFDGEHYFVLEKAGLNTTKLIHGENFSGILSGALHSMIANDTEKGFKLMNEALKNRVESGD